MNSYTNRKTIRDPYVIIEDFESSTTPVWVTFIGVLGVEDTKYGKTLGQGNSHHLVHWIKICYRIPFLLYDNKGTDVIKCNKFWDRTVVWIDSENDRTTFLFGTTSLST